MTMKKRILALLVSVMTVFALCAPAALAAESTDVTASESKPITAQLMNNKDEPVYSDKALKNKIGTLFGSDIFKILYIDLKKNLIYIEYPTANKPKEGYIKASKVFLSLTGAKYKASAQFDTFWRANQSSLAGYVSKGDTCFVLDDKNGMIQIVYEIKNGLKVAYARKNDVDKYLLNNTETDDDVEAQVQARLDQIAEGTLSIDSKTVMAVGKKFTGTRANEQCKGYAKNVYIILYHITPSSTQSKPNNHLLNSTNGMYKVGSVTDMTSKKISALFQSARPGDFVQMRRTHGGSHSAIVYSVNESKVTFLEANTDGKNGIKKQSYTWSTLCSKNAKMSVYTAENYKLK